MADDRARDAGTGEVPPASLGLLEVVRVPEVDAWTPRVTVAHADGPIAGWTPRLFGSAGDAERWLAARSAEVVRPAVRACDASSGALSYAVVLDGSGDELLVSAPVARHKAAAMAALLAAELRARSRAR